MEKARIEQEFQQYRQAVEIEVKVHEAIEDALMKKEMKGEREIRKLKMIMKTPRLYTTYCKENGINFYGIGARQ